MVVNSSSSSVPRPSTAPKLSAPQCDVGRVRQLCNRAIGIRGVSSGQVASPVRRSIARHAMQDSDFIVFTSSKVSRAEDSSSCFKWKPQTRSLVLQAQSSRLRHFAALCGTLRGLGWGRDIPWHFRMRNLACTLTELPCFVQCRTAWLGAGGGGGRPF
jgi:hypothetical protein